jgi:hypothetical protein
VGWVGPRADLDHVEKGKSLYGDFGFLRFIKQGDYAGQGLRKNIKYIEFP